MFTRNSIRLAALFTSLVAASAADATGEPELECDKGPTTPARTVVVTGFAGERLYFHSKHPSLCKDEEQAGCKATSFVLTGDKIKVSAHCGYWTYMTYAGKHAKASGWVSPRFAEPDQSSSLPLAQTNGKPLSIVCAEAESRFNDWLNQERPALSALPSAVTHKSPVDSLPGASGRNAIGPNVWSKEVGDARIAGKPIKTVGYGAGGTCHDSFLELWDPAFETQISIPTAGTDDTNSSLDPGDDTGYSSEDLVLLRGAPYFAHITRSAGIVKLYGFKKDLSAFPICEIVRGSSEKEFVKKAVDAQLCNAILTGRVQDGGLLDIEPHQLSGDLLLNQTPDKDRWPWITMIAKGIADPGNDGQPHKVAMLRYHDDSGAGCGHEYNSEWPVIIDDGLLRAATINNIAHEHAGGDNTSRIFRFRGLTYFETRSQPNADGMPVHEAWKLSADGATMMCQFSPARYRAVPIPVVATQ